MKKHVYVYSPSGAVRETAALRRGVTRLRAMGYEVEIDADALRSHMRFAGDDATRVAAIGRAAASGADWAIISRGGYGLTRILDQLDYKSLARAIGKGTQFVGHSDFTALQCALLAKTGSVTWAGPAMAADFGSEVEPDEIMLACFDDVASGRSQGTGWRLPGPRPRARSVTPPEKGAGPVSSMSAPPRIVAPQQRQQHVRNATLWGGNLSILASLVGTPWLPQVKGGVLFLEDVSEHPYRVERMLTQLLQGGVLQRQRALLFGQFTNYELLKHDRGFRLGTVLQWLRDRLRIPVLENLPFGHVPTKVMLPVGMPVDLLVEGREALILW